MTRWFNSQQLNLMKGIFIMTNEKRIDILSDRLSEDFSKIVNRPTMYRSDFAGVYVEDDKFNIILTSDADRDHYKQVLNDDSVIYHYTDISYSSLIETRNMLRDFYDIFNIVAAAIIDCSSTIELTVTNNESITDIKNFLKSRNYTDSFINNHFSFKLGEAVNITVPEDTPEIDDSDLITTSNTSTNYIAYPGLEVQGKNTYTSPKYAAATVGFSAKTSTTKGIVTAWHYATHVSKHYWAPPSGNFATNADTISSPIYDSTFIAFNSSYDGTTSTVSKVIYNTSKTITNVATSSTLSSISGKTLHHYGHIHSNVTGTVDSTSTDYTMTYTSYSGTKTTFKVKDTIRIKGATSLGSGDSGGPVTYESGSKIILIGTISAQGSTYQYINKVTNITSALGVTVTG